VAGGVLLQTGGPASAVPAVEEEDALSITQIASRVEQKRGLKFVRLPQFIATAADVIHERHRAQWREEDVQLKKRAWCALGFRWEPDWPVADAFAGLAAEMTG